MPHIQRWQLVGQVGYEPSFLGKLHGGAEGECSLNVMDHQFPEKKAIVISRVSWLIGLGKCGLEVLESHVRYLR